MARGLAAARKKQQAPVAGKAATASSALTGKAKLKAFQRKMGNASMRRAVARLTAQNTALRTELAASWKKVGGLQQEKHWDWDEIAALKAQMVQVRLNI